MSIFLKCKNSLSSRLKTLTASQAQRFTHTVTEPNSRPCRKKEGYGSVSQPKMSKWKKIDANRLGVYRWKIPPYVWAVLNKLHGRGFPVYLVGGCVRDFLLKRVPKDIDVVTTAGLKEVKKIFRNCFIVGKRFPICRVQIRDSVVEVSSFGTVASDSKEKETQILPKKPVGCDKIDFICWKDSIRRDFTINSLFFDPFQNKIYDYANGMEDIKTLKLRTLKPAYLSFQEDCARILRGLRIAGRLGLSISKDTEMAIGKLASSVKNLEKGRIMMELNYMLAYGAAESTIYMLQRFNLLEIFFPFHAAYLIQQFNKISSRNSVMLMNLFINLDKLVTCDRPCHCNLWLGLLAFHQALVTNPQDAFVVWVFASVLYHGSWKEGVKFARKNAKLQLQVNFVPEISGCSDLKSDDKVSEEVSHLAALVQDSVGALVDANVLVQSNEDQDSSLSGLAFVSKKIEKDVARLFDVLLHEINTYEHGRKSFMIDYKLLGKGIDIESRFVLGQIIMETLSGRCQVTKEEQEVMETKYGPKQSDLVLHGASLSSLNYKKHRTCQSDPEFDKKIPKKQKVVKVQSLVQEVNLIEGEVNQTHLQHQGKYDKQHATDPNEKCQEMSDAVKAKHRKKKVVKVQSLSSEEVRTKKTSDLAEGEVTRKCNSHNQEEYNEKHPTVHNKKRQGMSRENKEDVVKVKRPASDHEENILMTGSKSGNRSDGENIKCKIRSQKVAKEKSSMTSLSSLFRR